MTVMDEDSHCHEPLGEIRVALKKLRPHQPNNANVYLEKPVKVRSNIPFIVVVNMNCCSRVVNINVIYELSRELLQCKLARSAFCCLLSNCCPRDKKC